MKRFITTLFGIGVFVVLLLPKATNALTVSPPLFDYRLNLGDVQIDVINLFNESDTSLTVYPILMNFTSRGDEGGIPDFYPAGKDPFGQALAPWITIDKAPVTIEPQERVSIPFTINVPSDRVQPGGHYGAIMLSTVPSDVEAGITIGQQVGALILVNVSGEVREVGYIAEFGYQDPQPWYDHLPVDFFVRFENSGNTHLRPSGHLFIKNWYGKQVAALKVNEGFNSVLPNSIRRLLFGWQINEVPEDASELKKEWKNFALGRYTATLVMNYGSENKILTAERVFYVWPWRLLTIFGIAVALGAMFLWTLNVLYERAIIASHEGKKRGKKLEEGEEVRSGETADEEGGEDRTGR